MLTPEGESDIFEIMAVVLQGDTVAPYLFVISLGYALRRTIMGSEELLGFTLSPRQSRRVSAVVETDFDFADDIALVSDSVQKAQALLHTVESECKKIGL